MGTRKAVLEDDHFNNEYNNHNNEFITKYIKMKSNTRQRFIEGSWSISKMEERKHITKYNAQFAYGTNVERNA